MNKIAEVHFAYSPKNDDELELTVGDKIEVIGVEEEGWWRGKLKGRIGVFPSNFVVVESTSNTTPSSIQQQHSATSSKLNSIFGSKLGSKSSLSSNSLNTINSTSNNSLNHNYTSANGNNLTSMMNSNSMNTHQAESVSVDSQNQNESFVDESNNNSFSERKPKPVRGIGYGDIFATGAKPKLAQSIESAKTAVGSIVASERLGSGSGMVGSTLQKPVPKKPPPPTPVGNNIDQASQNGSTSSTSDQAPALPPKPSNQSFNSFMNQSRLMPQQLPTSSLPSQRDQTREQARVIHAYEPSNDDELELKVNDIINIIDKKSEDHGWWKGELNGKIGVFPDNFVQLITSSDQQPDWRCCYSSSGMSNSNVATATSSSVFSPPQQQPITSTESRVKSVFSSTPKGFSRELESNLERHNANNTSNNNNNNPASFLSLKRNKLPATNESSSLATNNTQLNTGFIASASRADSAPNSSVQNGQSSSGTLENSPSKLNHITANRAKGPSRRPPSNVLNKRIQSAADSQYDTSSLKKESLNKSSKEEQSSMVGLPAPSSLAPTRTSITMPANSSEAILASSTIETPNVLQSEHKQSPPTGLVSSSPFTTSSTSNLNGYNASPSSIKPSSVSSNLDNQQLFGAAASMATPKVGQKISQQPDNGIVRSGQKASTPASGSPPASTPPWMVNLRKTNAEKKREPTATAATTDTSIHTSDVTTLKPAIFSTAPAAQNSISTTAGSNVSSNSISATLTDTLADGQQTKENNHEQARTNPTSTTNSVSVSQLNESLAKYDILYKQISADLTNGLSELKKDVKNLQDDMKGIIDLKDAIEGMKIELKACQSATENQRKYIKELVGNLADERKKIASMQIELDRNLK